MFGFGGFKFINHYTVFLLLNGLVVLIIAAIGATPLSKNIAVKLMDKIKDRVALSTITENVVLVAIFMLCIFYLVAGSYNPFLYFRF